MVGRNPGRGGHRPGLPGLRQGQRQRPPADPQGQHPSNWLATHWIAFNQNQAQCTPCHGSYTDPNFTGGTTGINCFSCHAQQTPPVLAPLHPAGWQTVGNIPFHGTVAKAAASLTAGFNHCSQCHGVQYNNPVSAAGIGPFTCFTCHTTAPHPPLPWHNSPTENGMNHATTDPSNAAECAKCHLDGNNPRARTSSSSWSRPPPARPRAASTTPCATATTPGTSTSGRCPRTTASPPCLPGPTAGFAYCVTCHDYTDASGAGPSCEACHTTAPHPPAAAWTNPADTNNSHEFTNQGNAPECAKCHTGGANSSLQPSPPAPAGTAPGCFNNTLCHGANP